MRDAIAQVARELRSPLLSPLTFSYGPRTLPALRTAFNLRTAAGHGVTVVKHRTQDNPTVAMLVTSPPLMSAPAPAVLWIHSGGMVVGSPQFEVQACGRIARELGAVVVSPKYRLAPEHPFPAALDDCMTTLRWIRAHAEDLGIDPHRIAVAGASAGGGLAAAVAQRSHDEGITLRAQALMYPMLDDRTPLRGGQPGRGRLVWTPESNRFGWTSYLGREPRWADAPDYAAPARRADLTSLPAAWIGVGDLDLLHDEGVHYAQRLQDCTVACTLITVPGMYHVADLLKPKASSMQDFWASMLEFLDEHL